MTEYQLFDKRAKIMLGMILACAFLAVLATVDSAEQFRTWRAAKDWTTEQQAAAPALDAPRMYGIMLAALIIQVAVIAFAAIGGLTLGMAVTLDSSSLLKAALVFSYSSMFCGLMYSGLTAAYRYFVGDRKILKGPILDYSLSIQPPIFIAALGFAVFAAWFVIRDQKLKVQSGRKAEKSTSRQKA